MGGDTPVPGCLVPKKDERPSHIAGGPLTDLMAYGYAGIPVSRFGSMLP